MKTFDARSLPPIAQEDLRRKAVNAVLGGKRHTEVARILGVTRHAVDKWFKAYRQGGVKMLRAKPRGHPKGRRLQSWQAAQTVRLLLWHTPDQLGLPFALWTRQAVGELIEQRFGLALSQWTIGRYLRQWGMTPQKPVRRAFEQNPEEVRHWLIHEYPAIRLRARREKARIYWVDELGLRSDHQAGRSFGRRGQTPTIPGSGKPFRCNAISAITNRGQLGFMVFSQGFDTPVFIEFLRCLIRHSGTKVFVIVDGHPVHRSGKVKQWLKRRHEQIEMFMLPGYSPELNPDELLNQDLKTNAVGRRRPHDQQEMMRNVRSYLHRRQRQPGIVRNFFKEPHVRYASV